jgi:hypothetical protein
MQYYRGHPEQERHSARRKRDVAHGRNGVSGAFCVVSPIDRRCKGTMGLHRGVEKFDKEKVKVDGL